MNKRKSDDHFDLLPENSVSSQFLGYSGKRTEMLLTLTKSELKTVTGNAGREGFLDPTSVKRQNPKSILGYLNLKDIQLTLI
jgi:hypothetical protein